MTRENARVGGRWLGGSGNTLVPLLEKLQRASATGPTAASKHRIAGERQLSEQLQGIPQVLAGPLEGRDRAGGAGKETGGRQDAGK